jgi:O-antigen/teichoic acid export membrane protein
LIEAINSNKKQSAILGFSSTLLTQVIAIGLAFLFSVIFTRILGPAGRGVYSVFTSSAMILVQLSALGFPTANAYYCSKDEENLPALFGNSLILTAVFTIFFLALLFVWPDLQKYLSIDPAYFQIGLWFFAISIPLNFLSQLMRDLLLGKRWFIQYNLAKISTVVSFGVLGLILILFLSNKIWQCFICSRTHSGGVVVSPSNSSMVFFTQHAEKFGFVGMAGLCIYLNWACPSSAQYLYG